MSLFRFVEAFSGKISIDGIDIASVGLTELRRKVTIIPRRSLSCSTPLDAEFLS